jgi:hypothetical protein
MGVLKRFYSKHWHIECVAGGVYRATAGTSDKTKARAMEARMRTVIKASNDPSSLPEVTLGEAVTHYIDTVIRPENNAMVHLVIFPIDLIILGNWDAREGIQGA